MSDKTFDANIQRIATKEIDRLRTSIADLRAELKLLQGERNAVPPKPPQSGDDVPFGDVVTFGGSVPFDDLCRIADAALKKQEYGVLAVEMFLDLIDRAGWKIVYK